MEKKGICVANVHSARQPLRLGQLQGNHFDIIVRNLKQHSNDCCASLKERILEAIESVKVKKSVINAISGHYLFSHFNILHTNAEYSKFSFTFFLIYRKKALSITMDLSDLGKGRTFRLIKLDWLC